MAAEGALRQTPATIGSVTGLAARTGPPNAPSSGRFIRIHPMEVRGLRPVVFSLRSRTNHYVN